MIYQSDETNVYVSVNSVSVPAVTAVDIELVRSADGGTVNINDVVYRVTVKRYFPVGLQVDNFFSLRAFDTVIVDSWHIHSFGNCEWVRLERNLNNDGVTETAVFQASSLSVM